MPDADNIEKQNNISVVSYLCSVFLKNETGTYDAVGEKTIESTEVYQYRLDKAGQYKFSFEEMHDGSRTNNKIDFSIEVGLDKADKNVNITNMPGVNNVDTTKNASDKITINSVKVKANKITGKVSEKGATVKVKVGKKAYKKAKVKGYKFSYSLKNVKKGTKIKVKVIKEKKIAKKTYKYS